MDILIILYIIPTFIFTMVSFFSMWGEPDSKKFISSVIGKSYDSIGGQKLVIHNIILWSIAAILIVLYYVFIPYKVYYTQFDGVNKHGKTYCEVKFFEENQLSMGIADNDETAYFSKPCNTTNSIDAYEINNILKSYVGSPLFANVEFYPEGGFISLLSNSPDALLEIEKKYRDAADSGKKRLQQDYEKANATIAELENKIEELKKQHKDVVSNTESANDSTIQALKEQHRVEVQDLEKMIDIKNEENNQLRLKLNKALEGMS